MNLLKNLKGDSETYYYLKVSGVDLFKYFNARARGGRPGLIIMLKIFRLIRTYLKALTPEPAEAARDLLLCLKFLGLYGLI